MNSELLDELTERLTGLGVDRDEALEILRELQESSYAEGYDQGVADARHESEDPEDDGVEVPEPWDGAETWDED